MVEGPPTKEERQADEIRRLNQKLGNQKRAIQILEATAHERNEQLNLLGIAWSLRGSGAKEQDLTLGQVKQLVANVDRIQRRFFNIEYRLMYPTIEDSARAMVRFHQELSTKDRVHASRYEKFLYELQKDETNPELAAKARAVLWPKASPPSSETEGTKR